MLQCEIRCRFALFSFRMAESASISSLCFSCSRAERPWLCLFMWPPRIWVIGISVGQEGCQSVLIFAVANIVRFNTRATAKIYLLYLGSKSHLPMKNALPKRFSGLPAHASKTQRLYNSSFGEGIQVSNRKIKVQYADNNTTVVLPVTRNQLTASQLS